MAAKSAATPAEHVNLPGISMAAAGIIAALGTNGLFIRVFMLM
jgi:hypothetical protein